MFLLSLLCGPAWAAPYAVVVDAVPEDRDAYDALLEDLAGRSPADATGSRVFVREGAALVPVDERLPLPPSIDKPEPRAAPADHPGDTPGALTGKAVYLSQCHGWIWYDSLGTFSTQRGDVHDTVEDFHNVEAADQFLTAYLENAGAAVYTAKERDPNPEWAVVDDGDPAYEEVGDGFSDGPPGYGHQDTWVYGENPFETGGTRRFPASGGGVARWTPTVPSDGWYAVYVSWDSAADNARDAHYRVIHRGGTIDRRFDQTVHGSTWQYVETLWLPAGEGGLVVELVGDATSGTYVSADAVRIGGGVGVVERHGELHGRPRFEEGAILATQFNGAPPEVYDPYDDGDGSDPSSRSLWAAWEHPDGEDAVYLSWHSNACDECGARGTSVYTYDPDCSAGPPADGSEDFAELLQEELIDAGTSWDPTWEDRGTRSDCFSEVNPALNDEMPSALVELAFHDTLEDAEALKDPRFRDLAARAMYRAIVRFFAARDGASPVYLPAPPEAVAVTHGDDGRLVVSWRPGPSGGLDGDPASAYVVQTSSDGRSWDAGFSVTGTSTTLDTAAGEAVWVRVSAENDGGRSFPSDVVGGRRSPDGVPAALIVAAFDRLDTGMLTWESPSSSLDGVVRMNVRRMNDGTVAVAHGEAIGAAGWPYDVVTDDALDGVDLSAYRLVVWATGEESTADETFSTEQQAALRAFVSGGGALWASGAEILWDLDEKGTDDDRAFAADVLGAALADDDAGSEVAVGEGLLAGLSFDFSEAAGSPYPVEWPDVLTTERDVIASYESGGVAAAIGDRVVLFGFPFEAIGDPTARATAAARLLSALVPDYTPPRGDGTGDDTGNNGLAGGGPGEREPTERIGGCGCGTTGGPSGLLTIGLALVAGWVRRPRRAGRP